MRRLPAADLLVEVRWGDVSGWITAIATVLALIAASVAARQAKAIVQLELERDEKRKVRDDSNQASQVAVWATESVAEPTDPTSWIGRFTVMSVSGFVVNNSSQPVYDVQVAWFVGEEQVYSAVLAVLPPKGLEQWKLPTEVIARFDDATRERGDVVLRSLDEARLLSRMTADRLRLEVSFRDSSNQRWHRDRTGRLEKSTLTSDRETPNVC
jgi:hypothetical protein